MKISFDNYFSGITDADLQMINQIFKKIRKASNTRLKKEAKELIKKGF